MHFRTSQQTGRIVFIYLLSYFTQYLEQRRGQCIQMIFLLHVFIRANLLLNAQLRYKSRCWHWVSQSQGNLSMKIGFSLQQVQGELGKGNVCTMRSRGLYIILATYGRSATWGTGKPCWDYNPQACLPHCKKSPFIPICISQAILWHVWGFMGRCHHVCFLYWLIEIGIDFVFLLTCWF